MKPEPSGSTRDLFPFFAKDVDRMLFIFELFNPRGYFLSAFAILF